MACWLTDYSEWLQFCWEFVKPPRNDEIALQHFFFLLVAVQEFFSISYVLHAIFFFQPALAGIFFFQNHPSPPQELNGRPLINRLNPRNKFILRLNSVPRSLISTIQGLN